MATRAGGTPAAVRLSGTQRAVLEALAAIGRPTSEAQFRVLAAFRDELHTLRDAAAASTTYDGTVCGIIEHHVPRRHDAVKTTG